MAIGEHVESQPAPKLANDGAHAKLSLDCRLQPQKVAPEVAKSSPESFLKRLGEATLQSENGSPKVERQAKAAWTKVFEPAGFAGKEEPRGESLCMENIYGNKA